jgi:tetratricopeptide (TPR) repeat protein
MSWDQHILDATTTVQKSDYAATEQSLKLALQLAKENFDRSDSRLALTLSFLGHVYFACGEFDRAEMLLEQSLRLAQQQRFLNYRCVHVHVHMDMFCLAHIKAGSRKHLELCRLLESALAVLEASGGAGAGSGAEAVDDRSAHDFAINHFGTQLQQCSALLSDEERRQLELEASMDADDSADDNSEEDTETAGTAYSAESVAPDEEALAATRIDKIEIDSGQMSRLWEQLLQKGLGGLSAEEEERESWVTGYLNIESALRLANQLFQPGDERLTSSIKALADASAKLKMFEQAEALYRESIACAKRAPDCDLNVTALRLTLGLFYADFDQLRQAKKILEGAQVSTNLQDSPHGSGLVSRVANACRLIGVYDSVQNLVRQAQTAAEQKDLEKATKLTNTALTTLRQGFAPNHPEAARVLRYRAELLLQLEQHEQAAELKQRAERIEKAQQGIVDEWTKITEDLPKPDLTVSV